MLSLVEYNLVTSLCNLFRRIFLFCFRSGWDEKRKTFLFIVVMRSFFLKQFNRIYFSFSPISSNNISTKLPLISVENSNQFEILEGNIVAKLPKPKLSSVSFKWLDKHLLGISTGRLITIINNFYCCFPTNGFTY